MPDSQPNNLLDQLPAIHLPAPISFWPPAIGWWLLAGLLLVLCVLVVRYLQKRKRKNQYRKIALKELARHWQTYQKTRHPANYLLAVNRLLKQFVMQQYPDNNLHTLSGAQWLKALAELSPQSGVNPDTAAALLGIYAQRDEQSNEDIYTLHPLFVRWFKSLR